MPVIGGSLVLNQPRLGGAAHGYPFEPEATERIARSPLRRGFALLPGFARDRMMKSIRCELTAAAAYAGPPSVAHAEALLRAVESRSAPLDAPLDAIVIGIPRTTPTFRASGRTRCWPPTSAWGSRSGSGGTRSRSSTGAR